MFEQGREIDHITAAQATARGLTVIDLADTWTPLVFRDDPALGAAGHQPYREMLLDLENERFGEGPEWDRARSDRYLELFGIFPSFSVLRARLLDERRHVCHRLVEDDDLAAETTTMRALADREGQRTRAKILPTLRRQLERARVEHGVATDEELVARERRYAWLVRRHREAEHKVAVVAAMQAHLACDDLLSRRAEHDVFDLWTAAALKTFQRKHMIISWGLLDDDTRRALVEDPLELDYRAVLRALRERVVDATGLIEDGSASGGWSTVVGRNLDAEEFHHVGRYDALPNGAPDLVSAATDRAARELGWTSPNATREWFRRRGEHDLSALRVAVKLPPKPSWHRDPMQLRAEIDRGDVWYDYPFTGSGKLRAQPEHRRPTLTLYTKDGDHEVALVRWDTTIGGWQPERLSRGVVRMKYKESPAGARVWRDLIASPAWLPPDSTPEDDLVRRRPGGDVVNSELFGPGYASAYGLAMLVNHLRVQPRTRPDPVFWDQGVRVHGSVSYASILRAHSHGCHRLFNHMAVRLTSFLLQHREHVRRGVIPARYQRDFVWEGRAMRLRLATRGYLYELTPPIDVRILEGHIAGHLRRAPTGVRMLREQLLRRAAQSGAALEGGE